MFLTNQRALLFILRSGADAPTFAEAPIDREGWLDVMRASNGR
jgi:hypothetical protein